MLISIINTKFVELEKLTIMRVIHLSAEYYPLAKVGGLGDVAGALPKYENKEKEMEVAVVMPYVYNENVEALEKELDHKAVLLFGKDILDVKIWRSLEKESDYLYLVEIEGFTHRKKVYGYGDDDYYFVAFQVAALNWIHQWGELPDIIHCHDYHTGFIPFFMQHAHQYPRFRNIPSIFTIHNGKYQGNMPWEIADFFPWFDTWQAPLLSWNNNINAMATAIKCAWKVTTVSPQYMKELMYDGGDLAPLFKKEESKCIGILNGIDAEEWNPATDDKISLNYNIKTVNKGKNYNKQIICEQFEFNPQYPLIAFIGRFVHQKGVDVLLDAIWKAINEADFKANFLLIGSGDTDLMIGAELMKENLPDEETRYNYFLGYDEALARQVYAGADYMVMPSRFEPCGLNQFYTFRYGGIPIVRTVGGLLDSVIDYEDKDGNGIRFIQLSPDDILHSFYRAIELYKETTTLNRIRKNNMKLDFSWESSVKKYIDLYKNIRY